MGYFKPENLSKYRKFFPRRALFATHKIGSTRYSEGVFGLMCMPVKKKIGRSGQVDWGGRYGLNGRSGPRPRFDSVHCPLGPVH